MKVVRLLLWPGVVVLLLVLVVAVFAVWLAHTEAGTRWALERAARGTGTLSFDNVSGTLFGQLDIADMRYADDTTELNASGISVQLDPGRLLAGELHVRELVAETVSYAPRPATKKTRAGAAPGLPIDLTIDDVRIGRIVIGGERDEQIDNVAARAQWRGNLVTVESLALTVRDIELQIAGTVRLREQPEIDMSVDWRSLTVTDLRGSGNVAGDTANLSVQHELSGRYAVSTRGTVELQDGTARVDLSNTSRQLDYLAGERLLQFRDVRLSIAGPLDGYELQWEAALNSPGLPPLHISGDGEGNLQMLQVDNLSVAPPRGSLTGSGELRWAPAVAWQFDITGADIDPALLAEQWPGDINGRLTFSGGLVEAGLRYEARNIDISGTLRERNIAITGGLRQAGSVLELEQLRLRAGGGSIESIGRVTLGEQTRWQADLSLRDVDPALLFEDWPGRLSGRLEFSGSRSATDTSVALDKIRIDGRLRDQPLQLRGTMKHDGKALILSGVDARSGNNRVRVDGRFGQRLGITYDADITDLGALGPQFEGSLTGKGRIAGTVAAPLIEVDLTGNGLRVPGYAIGTLRAAGELAPRGRQAMLRIEAGELTVREQRIENMRATVRGSLENHGIVLELSAPAGTVNANLAGGWQEEQWRGELTDSRFDMQQAGSWQQRSPAGVRTGVGIAQVTELCWQQDAATVCIDGGVDAGALAVTASASEVAVDLLRRFLPPGTTAGGTISATARLRGTPVNPQLEFSAGAPRVDISYRYSEDEDPVSATVEEITIDGTAGPERLSARLSLSGQDEATLLINGELTQWRSANPRVSARFDTTLPDATLLGLLSTRISNVTGSLRADARIDGDLRQPVFSGFARLDNAGASIPAAGITLTETTLELRPAGPGQVAITGAAASGGGRIELAGTLRLDAAAGWPLTGSITGQRFTAVQLPGIDVAVSPDLRLGGNIRELRFDGNVVADRAIVEFKELPEQAVRISPDVIVVSAGETEQRRETLLQLAADLTVQLGEEVRFSGFGLRTGLDGELALRLIPGRPPQGRGLITLESGQFQAYGQNLVIDSGTLLFTGDLEDPTLDVEAVRSFDDVKVGIRLSGTGRVPVSTVFSEPAMAEADALSYLVIGRPLAEATAAEGRTIQNSAILLGAVHAAAITDQIGQAVGLDELRLDTRSVDTGAIMAGKRIGPDLYIRYSYGLFNRIGALLLRYQLNSRMSLEARSGEDQSLDLIYTRETD